MALTKVSSGMLGNGGGDIATNSAIGTSALNSNTTGASNTAVGYESLATNTTSSFSTAVGYQAGNLNTAAAGAFYGAYAGATNSTGANNIAIGTAALRYNTTGSNNAAVGRQALQENTTANNNTAVGYQAGYSNTTGQFNVYTGSQAGSANTGSGANTFVGNNAGSTFNVGSGNSFNTFIGCDAGSTITTGTKNTILGAYNGNQGGLDIRTASNRIILSDGDGNPRLTDAAGTAYWPAIYANTTASGANVQVDAASGLLRRVSSALKYKDNVRDLPSKDINALRAVVYNSNCVGDDQSKEFFGIIADEADAAGFKELVTYGADGEIEGFQYDRLTVVLLKAIQEQQAIITDLKARIETLEAK